MDGEINQRSNNFTNKIIKNKLERRRKVQYTHQACINNRKQ